MPNLTKQPKGYYWLWIAGSAVVIVLALSYACQPAEGQPIQPTQPPLAWITETPTVTPAPTDTPEPTATPTPTATQTQPTETATLIPEATDTPEPTATPTPRRYALIHEVQEGQWLSTIAAHYYAGDWERWPQIMKWTNQAAEQYPDGCFRYIDDPHWIYPGDCLLIPVIND